jgi:hypothetical protein
VILVIELMPTPVFNQMTKSGDESTFYVDKRCEIFDERFLKVPSPKQ